MDRRDFLKLGAAGAAAGLLGWPRPLRADTAGYRALVCVFLYGGNDAFNMIVPASAAEYAAYAASRQNLALAPDVLLPINPLTADGARYGLHPSMGRLQALFEAGRAAVIANVGPLVQPTTRDEARARAVPLPPQLFSHIDQQEQWQTLRGTGTLVTGWAGRVADQLAPLLPAQRLPINVSITGTVPLSSGDRTSAYVVGDQGVVGYAAIDAAAPGAAARRQAMGALLADAAPTPYGRALQRLRQRAFELADITQAALAQEAPLATTFPATPLGRQLAMVARLIAARGPLAMQRQVFIVGAGGFDTHDDQLALQPGLLGALADALAAFDAATVELGVDASVTTFTMSDFGRTLTSNGDGTDHGWGAHQLVIGGAVRGRDLYGTMPRLEIDGPDDLDAGRIVPTLGVQPYAATLLKWFGLDAAAIDAVIPDVGRFARRDLGFMLPG
ncbi:MAG: DUF1501 domain-containing protein [Steroidobacteraceae bacterium]